MAYRHEVVMRSEHFILKFVYSRQEAVVTHVFDHLASFATIPNLLHCKVCFFRFALTIFVCNVEDPLLIQNTLLIFVERWYDVFVD